MDGVYRDLAAAARSDQITLDASTYDDVASKGPVPERPNDSLTVDSAEMYYTSGTSGRPKGVVLTRRNVLLHALQCIVEHRISSKDVWLHVAPMFHLVDAYAIFAQSPSWKGRHLDITELRCNEDIGRPLSSWSHGHEHGVDDGFATA